MRKSLSLGLILALFAVVGWAFMAEASSSVETQFELAQKFMERAGLVGTAPTEEPAAEEPPAEEPPAEEPAPTEGTAEDPAAEPTEDPAAPTEEVEDVMPAEIAEMVAERHAFIGWAKMNGLPASRNIQNQELWGTVWGSVKEQVAAGATVQDAVAAAQAALDETQLGTLDSLKGTPPGQLSKAAKETATEETASAASAGTGKGTGKGKGESKGESKGEGKGNGGGKGGGKNK
jgi:hypothetical protein